MNYYKDDFSIKIVGNVINKINCIINANLQTQRNDISSLFDKLNKLNKSFDKLEINKTFDKLEINNINKQELKCIDGKYIGQVVNGIREGKGTWYGFNGDRYEGEWKNDKKEGKGIYYHNNGDRYEGDYRNGEKEGKGIYYYNREPFKGDVYEGDWRNGKREGKGIYYWNDGDRRMGDYYNNKPIGKHVVLTKDGDVEIENW